jgi:Zn-dependent protease
MFGRSALDLLLSVPAILIAITIHEFAHAWMADRLGDPTPRQRGRLSLNPLVHLDPLGTLMLLIARFGWAKPVEVNPRYFANWRMGMIQVAVAGPLSNIVLAFAVGFLVRAGVFSLPPLLGQFALYLVLFNVILAVFNLLPVPPLDGSRVVSNLLPPEQAVAYDRLARYGPLLLLALILLPGNLLGFIMGPPIDWLLRQALGYGSL